MVTTGERIKHIRGSQARDEFARHIGVHKNTLANYERDDRAPDAAVLTVLADDGWSVNWILTGEGTMRLAPNQAPAHADMVRDVLDDDADARVRRQSAIDRTAKRSMSLYLDLKAHLADAAVDLSYAQREQLAATLHEALRAGEFSDFVEVPLYNVEASAGDGALVPSEEVLAHYAFRRDFVRQAGWRPEDLALVRGRGDSMPGVVDDGQLVLVDLSKTSIGEYGIYLLRLDDHLMIKAAQVDHRGTVYIRSTNPIYREVAVPKEERGGLQVLGRAVWTDRLL